MTELKSHTFPNGDMLQLTVIDTYAGYRGLKVYTLSYLEQDSDPETGEDMFSSHNGNTYMSEAAAMAGFEARLASSEPFNGHMQDGGITHLVLSTFQKYLGEGTIHRVSIPQDWDGFTKHVLEATFGRRETGYYAGEKICSTLEELSFDLMTDKSEVMLEIPAWKMLEIMTAITTLSMALKQIPYQTLFSKVA